MYLQYRDLKLIQTNNRPDQDNKDILDGKYDNSETPLSYEERIATIFSDWQQGDILVIADQPLKYPKLSGDTLVEMTREEVCESGDLSVLNVGEVYQDGKITKKEPSDDLFKPKWEYPNWVEKATKEEIQNKYYSIIDKLKEEILDVGFEFRGYQQKVREKDRNWLAVRIIGMERKAIIDKQITPSYELLVDRGQLYKEGWVFDTGKVEMFDVFDLQEMLFDGDDWSSALFKAEQILKTKESNILITKENFIEEIHKHTTVKCWKEVING